MLYVVAYDVPSDRLRRRLSTVLEAFGARVQGSVFEVRIPEERRGELERALQVLFRSKAAGQVRVYPVCERCYGAAFGMGAIADPSTAEGHMTI